MDRGDNAMDERLEPCETCGEAPHIWKTGKFLQDLAYDEHQLAYDNDPQCRPLLITEVVIVRCEKCGHQVFRPISEPGATASAVYRWNRTYGHHNNIGKE